MGFKYNIDFFKNSFLKEDEWLMELNGVNDDSNSGLIVFVTKKGLYIIEKACNHDDISFLHKKNITSVKIKQGEDCFIRVIVGLNHSSYNISDSLYSLTLNMPNMETAHNFFKIITKIID